MRLRVISCYLCLLRYFSDAKDFNVKVMPTPVYLGCYKEGEFGDSDMTYRADDWNSNPSNVTYCARECRKSGYTYAGLQIHLCFCSNTFGNFGSVNDSKCDRPCKQQLTLSHRVPHPSDGLRCGFTKLSAVYLVCPMHYYGEWCEDNCNCLRNPCNAATGRCDEKKCVPGWKGTNCNIHTPCSSNPCKHEGECFKSAMDKTRDYKCFCRNGFYGDNCEKGSIELLMKADLKAQMTTEYLKLATAFERPMSGIPFLESVAVYNRVYGQSSYLGCFLDTDGTDVPENFLRVKESMTVEYCVAHCSKLDEKFTVAAIKRGSQCRCANAFGKFGKGKESECNLRCESGKGTDFCGGMKANSIFTICPVGRYNTMCSMICNCANKQPCDLATGHCPASGCVPGWIGERCDKVDLKDTYTPEEAKMIISIIFILYTIAGICFNVYCVYKGYISPKFSQKRKETAVEEDEDD